MQLAAGTIKKVTLELGGKSPNIVLPDAQSRYGGARGVVATFMHQGQICEVRHARTRPRVDPRPARGEDGRRASSAFGSATRWTWRRNGPAREPGAARQRRAVRRPRSRAGGEMRCRGRRPAGMTKGYYYEPTVFDAVDNKMRIAKKRSSDGRLRHSVSRRGRSRPDRQRLGLWSRRCGVVREQGTRDAIARRIETGTVWINDYHMITSGFPSVVTSRAGLVASSASGASRSITRSNTSTSARARPPEGSSTFRC